MFFLAISMVGTDFSMIGQLFPHRDRAEIKVCLFLFENDLVLNFYYLLQMHF